MAPEPEPAAPATLRGVGYFDGLSAAARRADIHLDGGTLCISEAGVERRVAARDVIWPERVRHGGRVAHIPGGGSLQAEDVAAWDAWALRSGLVESPVVRLQQSWRWTLASAVVVCAMLAGLWLRGVPWVAGVIVAVVPTRVDASLGDAALRAIDEHLMRPSKLPPAEQARLRLVFESAVRRLPATEVPPHRILFRHSRIGPNAFALPGGTLVVTDELVALVEGDEAILTGVLGHELGHVRHRHGMRTVVQSAAIGLVGSLVLGDFSTVLAAVPVLLAQASYSRDLEREADLEAVRVLRAAGLSPAVMARFFEKVAEWRRGRAGDPARRQDAESSLGIAIASHPADAERIRFFRQAAP